MEAQSVRDAASLNTRDDRGSNASALKRRLPIGAEILSTGGVHFRVWAPDVPTMSVEWESPAGEAPLPLQRESEGYFSGWTARAGAGWRYRLRTPAGRLPDPASRFQPEGPHGPSEIVDPNTFQWSDQNWRGRPPVERVLYELHLGTFTPEGTWRSAMEQLPHLQQLGITVLEVMPIADFAGEFGWGYDGVNLFAPTRLYGNPDDVRAFVDRAHALGLMVILDVVYNHLGPEGNYLGQFAADYFSRTRKSEWGDAINFDGPNRSAVREFFISNARYWIDEYHFDGLRLDATQQIFDDSPTHILTEITAAAKSAGGERSIYIVGENEPQQPVLVRATSSGGFGLDALWNDDFHHSAYVAATGRTDAYFRDYRATPQEFISALKYGFLYQGQWYAWQKQRRGSASLDLQPTQFVSFLENHDQVANSLRGERLHQIASPAQHRALTALWLLSPQTPLFFQGQEFGSSAPFLYFADHPKELRAKVRAGRCEFLCQFSAIATESCRQLLADPGEPSTFQRCKLNHEERQSHAEIYRLHRDLLGLRRETPSIRAPERLDGAVLGAQSFVIRFFGSGARGDRLLLLNLGTDTWYAPAAEPLLAPPPGCGWAVRWCSEDPVYGGYGYTTPERKAGWFVGAHSAVLLEPCDEHEPAD